jgi:type VI secretion system ImpM family protein
VGFCGKIPAERDFVRVKAGAFLRAGLDRWFQEGVEHLRSAGLPAEPACFLLSPAASDQSFIGAFAPGADAIGRAFPVVIFAALERPLRADVWLVPLRLASFLQAGSKLATAASTLTANQLVAEIGALRPVSGQSSKCRTSGTRDRLLIALGPAPSLMLAYLADPEHEGSHRWPLRTTDPSARLKAMEELSPGQRRVLAAGNAPLADVLQIFAEA